MCIRVVSSKHFFFGGAYLHFVKKKRERKTWICRLSNCALLHCVFHIPQRDYIKRLNTCFTVVHHTLACPSSTNKSHKITTRYGINILVTGYNFFNSPPQVRASKANMLNLPFKQWNCFFTSALIEISSSWC